MVELQSDIIVFEAGNTKYENKAKQKIVGKYEILYAKEILVL